MNSNSGWLAKLRHLAGRQRFDADLAEELRLHEELRAGELQASGMDAEEARWQARRELGGVARIEEQVRDEWRFLWLEDLAGDLRYAGRALRRSPAFAAAAVFSIALGTAANTSVFSLAMELLFSQPSARDAGRLVLLRVAGGSHAQPRELRVLRDSGLYAGVAGMAQSEVNWRRAGQWQRLGVMRVSDNYFDVTGVPLHLGRGLAAGEPAGVVLQWSFWQREFGGAPDVVGRSLNLDGRLLTVAGVLPERHRTLEGLGYAPELYMTAPEDTALRPVARLGDGVTLAEALERLKAACGRMDQMFGSPEGPRERGAEVQPVSGPGHLPKKTIRTLGAFFVLLGLVSLLVLLVACANVSSLHLARATVRRTELSVRSALGAGRGRLVRQLLAESLLLAALGTVAGVALNLLLIRTLNGWALPLPIPVRLNVTPDWRLFGYSLAVAALTALASGVLPAVAATRRSILSGLQSTARGGDPAGSRLRGLVVAGQMAVTTVLLVTALLFLRNLAQAGATDPGFDVQHTVWATLSLTPDPASTPSRLAALDQAALERLQQLPGVERAAALEVVPLNDGRSMSVPFHSDLDATPQPMLVRLNRVSAGYFETLSIPLLAGRDFSTADRAGSEPVAIVNEELARRLFGGLNAVGHRLRWASPSGLSERLIVGVARNSKYMMLGEDNAPAFYEALAQRDAAGTTLHYMTRSARPPEEVAREARLALAALAPTAVVQARPMRSALELAFLPSRVGAVLLGSMGALGLLLASLGLYGVLAYSVSRRVREIGLRMALGAGAGAVLRLVFRRSLLLAGCGVAVGLAVAAWATQPLAMFLVPGVEPGDLSTYAAVAAILGLVSLAATTAPALRALSVDPTQALREE